MFETLPSNTMDFGNFTRLKDGIGNAAESGSDIKGENETARRPTVGFSSPRRGFHDCLTGYTVYTESFHGEG